METQMDYETDPVLAVFASSEQAKMAVDGLRSRRLDVCAVGMAPLAVGAYQAEDGSLRDGVAGVLRGAVRGVPIGAVAGLGLGTVLTDASLGVLSGLAGLGAFGGLVLGGFVGSIVRSRFDEDEAEWLAVREDDPTVVVVVHTGGDGRPVREVLRRAGAVSFLDPTTPEADRALVACRAAA